MLESLIYIVYIDLYLMLKLGINKNMRSINREIADRFAETFAGSSVGFSGREITDFFCKYSNIIKPYENYGFTPKRTDLFIESLYDLMPKEQYYALTDLCQKEHQSKYKYPPKKDREDLLHQLHAPFDKNPIALSFSLLREHVFREDWFVASNRIKHSPSSAITASRSMLETILKTIISERHETYSEGDDLQKLLKKTEELFNFNNAEKQGEHMVLKGMASLICGVSMISNEAGDRHGLCMGMEIDSPAIANLVLGASGMIGLFFIELHLLSPIEEKSI